MKRRVRVVIGVALGASAAVGLAHLPAVRGALLGPSCPFARTPSAAELEQIRLRTAASLRGTAKAGARPAIGFALDRTTREEVRAWGARLGATCGDELGGAAIRCEGARLPGEPAARDAFFRFDPRGHLVAVDVMREGQRPGEAAAFFERRAAVVTEQAGPPAAAHGVPSGEALGATYLARVSAEYRFVDYAAEVSATNLGARGVVVREQYRSLSGGLDPSAEKRHD